MSAQFNLPAVIATSPLAQALAIRLGRPADRFELMMWKPDTRYFDDHDGWRRDLMALDGSLEVRADKFRAACQPLKVREPGLNGPQSGQVITALAPLANKIAPTMEDAAVKSWTVAMVMALSDMPPAMALEAMGRAMHVPIRFISDVETVIRDQARLTLFAYEMVDNRYRKLLGGPFWPRILPSLPKPAKD